MSYTVRIACDFPDCHETISFVPKLGELPPQWAALTRQPALDPGKRYHLCPVHAPTFP